MFVFYEAKTDELIWIKFRTDVTEKRIEDILCHYLRE